MEPFLAQLQKNDRGFFIRVRMPDAPMRVGKLFFPDRNGVDSNTLYEGPIVITDISDRGNYGFFKGHMREMNAPGGTGLIHYLIDKELWNGLIDKYRTPSGDEFTLVQLMSGPRVTHKIFLEEFINVLEDGDEEDYAAEVPSIDDAAIPYCTKILETMTISDFITMYLHDEKYEDLDRRFQNARFSYKIHDRDSLRENTKFISHIFDQAIKDGIIYFYKYGSIPMIEINFLTLPEMVVTYNTHEINQLLEEITKINYEANRAIEGVILHGKARLVRQQFAPLGEPKMVSLR